jgi:hypothetical protein
MRSSSISLVQFRAFNSREITGGSDEQHPPADYQAAVKEETESQEQLLIDDSFFNNEQEETQKVGVLKSGLERHAKSSPKINRAKRNKKGVKLKFNSSKKDNKTYM